MDNSKFRQVQILSKLSTSVKTVKVSEMICKKNMITNRFCFFRTFNPARSVRGGSATKSEQVLQANVSKMTLFTNGTARVECPERTRSKPSPKCCVPFGVGLRKVTAICCVVRFCLDRTLNSVEASRNDRKLRCWWRAGRWKLTGFSVLTIWDFE